MRINERARERRSEIVVDKDETRNERDEENTTVT